MLPSISAITKKRFLWHIGLALCLGWVFYFLDAVYLFY